MPFRRMNRGIQSANEITGADIEKIFLVLVSIHVNFTKTYWKVETLRGE